MMHRILPADVISMCSSDGEIFPLRLQVEDAALGPVRIHIERILRHQKIIRTGIESHRFICSGKWNDRFVRLELIYWIRSHSWNVIFCSSF